MTVGGDDGCFVCHDPKAAGKGPENFICPYAGLSADILDGDNRVEPLFADRCEDEKVEKLAEAKLDEMRGRTGAKGTRGGLVEAAVYWRDRGAEYFVSDNLVDAARCISAFVDSGVVLIGLGMQAKTDKGWDACAPLLLDGEAWFRTMTDWLANHLKRLERIRCINGWSLDELAGVWVQIERGFFYWGYTIAALAMAVKEKGNIDVSKILFATAIVKYEKALRLSHTGFDRVFFYRGVALYRLFLLNGDKSCEEKAKVSLLLSNRDILGILSGIDGGDTEDLAEGNILYDMLDGENTAESRFFAKATESVARKDIDIYKSMYIRSICIVSELGLLEPFETKIANYMSASRAKDMLNDKEKFKLRPVDCMNDPKEGKVLLNYLFGNDTCARDTRTGNSAFVGCFTFNYDWLNQFIIYGKEIGGNPGTGLSLVFRRDFFKSYGETDVKRRKKRREDKKHSVYRCVYFDATNNRVASVGQIDEDLYRRNDRNYEMYERRIEAVTDAVRRKISGLKTFIDKAKPASLDFDAIALLLMRLRYLIKDSQFKGEQECRMLEIYDLSDGDERVRHGEGVNLFEEYAPLVSDYVSHIYFGQSVADAGQIQNFLKFKKLEVKCEMSSCEFRG